MNKHFQPQKIKNGKDNKKISVQCKFCKSKHFIRKGFRKTQHKGKIQKFYCKDCKNYFYC